jgi:hypothetical protein
MEEFGGFRLPMPMKRPIIPIRFALDTAKASYNDGASIEQAITSLEALATAAEGRALLKRLNAWDDHVVKAFYRAYRDYEYENRVMSPIELQPRPAFFRTEYIAINGRLQQLILIEYPKSALFFENRAPHPTFSLTWDIFVATVRNDCICAQSYPPTFDVCGEWRYLAPSGERFQGYWQYPEGSEEREDAGYLTMEENLAALEQLPYPFTLIQWSIGVGCNLGGECVAFSRQVCQWFDEMIDKTGILTPAEYVAYRLNCSHVPWDEYTLRWR